ncbi:unnamed protein product [Ectocarpus sp. CCAP 1310/34]|nr:unnamed protein product [Ectocarpus sp. CCAP 1310/34]
MFLSAGLNCIADLKDDLCEESLAHLNMDQLKIDSDDDEADSSVGGEGQPLISSSATVR